MHITQLHPAYEYMDMNENSHTWCIQIQIEKSKKKENGYS